MFGLPNNFTVFRIPHFGQGGKRKDRVVTLGTLLVNLAGNKLIHVAHSNI
jgi:hypothetical protein